MRGEQKHCVFEKKYLSARVTKWWIKNESDKSIPTLF